MKKTRIILVISLLANIAAAIFIVNRYYGKQEEVFMPKKKNVFAKKPKSTYFMGKDLLFNVLPSDSNSIVFLGDSHTEHFFMNELLGNENLVNRGISGDRLRGILKRLDPIIRMKPRKIFIQAGINDFGTGGKTDTVMAQYNRLLDIFAREIPQTKIYVQSIFPVENKLDKISTYCNPKVNKQVVKMNAFLKSNAEKAGYTYIDVHSALVLDGKLNPKYSFDGIHLTPEGYFVWTEIVKPYVNE